MELEAMQAAGLPPRDVLVAATRNAAARSGSEQHGRVTAGSVADLLCSTPIRSPTSVISARSRSWCGRGEVYTRHELAY